MFFSDLDLHSSTHSRQMTPPHGTSMTSDSPRKQLSGLGQVLHFRRPAGAAPTAHVVGNGMHVSEGMGTLSAAQYLDNPWTTEISHVALTVGSTSCRSEDPQAGTLDHKESIGLQPQAGRDADSGSTQTVADSDRCAPAPPSAHLASGSTAVVVPTIRTGTASQGPDAAPGHVGLQGSQAASASGSQSSASGPDHAVVELCSDDVRAKIAGSSLAGQLGMNRACQMGGNLTPLSLGGERPPGAPPQSS
jgi:hypothetical protein